jgi:hypothetical protein
MHMTLACLTLNIITGSFAYPFRPKTYQQCEMAFYIFPGKVEEIGLRPIMN